MSPTRRDRAFRDLRTTLICLAFSFIVGAGVWWLWVRSQEDTQNRTACVSKIILGRLAVSNQQAQTDTTITDSQRARAAATAKFENQLVNGLHTTPRRLDCYALLGLPQLKP